MRFRLLLGSLVIAAQLAPARGHAQPASGAGPIFRAQPDRPQASPASPPSAPMRVSVRLDYSRAANVLDACPDERGLRGAIAARLGYDPITSAPGPLPVVRLAIARHGSAFVARVEKRDPAGRVDWTRLPPTAHRHRLPPPPRRARPLARHRD